MQLYIAVTSAFATICFIACSTSHSLCYATLRVITSGVTSCCCKGLTFAPHFLTRKQASWAMERALGQQQTVYLQDNIAQAAWWIRVALTMTSKSARGKHHDFTWPPHTLSLLKQLRLNL